MHLEAAAAHAHWPHWQRSRCSSGMQPANQDVGCCLPARKQPVTSHARRSVLLLMFSCCARASAPTTFFHDCVGNRDHVPEEGDVAVHHRKRRQPSPKDVVPWSCAVTEDVFHRQYYQNLLAHDGSVNITQIQRKYSYGNMNAAGFGVSGSGDGSDLGRNTRNSLRFFAKAIECYSIRTMIDVPCGDVNWQFHAWEVDSLDLYLGLDIVRPTVAFQRARFEHHRNKLFAHWDMVNCPLPQVQLQGVTQPFDLVHIRHAIQHLSPANAAKAIDNVRESKAKYLVVSTFPDFPLPAPAIEDGGFYTNNMARPPFNFPPALACMPRIDAPTKVQSDWDHACLYRVSEIPAPNMSYNAPTDAEVGQLKPPAKLRGFRAPRWKVKHVKKDSSGKVFDFFSRRVERLGKDDYKV